MTPREVEWLAEQIRYIARQFDDLAGMHAVMAARRLIEVGVGRLPEGQAAPEYFDALRARILLQSAQEEPGWRELSVALRDQVEIYLTGGQAGAARTPMPLDVDGTQKTNGPTLPQGDPSPATASAPSQNSGSLVEAPTASPATSPSNPSSEQVSAELTPSRKWLLRENTRLLGLLRRAVVYLPENQLQVEIERVLL